VSDELTEFWSSVGFSPDEFQVEAAKVILDGDSVVVTAPTGSGKTLVAEAAIHLALSRGRRVFYTTPVKALSNQKFADFVDQHGPSQVGLLTGDNVVNPGARVIVATLEVLRNMIYADATQLDDTDFVILDEAHYLQDRSRGAGWEEVIIHCPPHVQFVCLSATISNNVEFAEWIAERRGTTRLVSTDHRPVPLESMYMLRDRMGSHAVHLLPTFVVREGRRRSNSRIEHMLGLERGRKRRFKTPNRTETIETLALEGMLPAIYFIFSRAGCDAAASRLAESGLRLTDPDERHAIREVAESRTDHLTDGDLDVLGYGRWIAGLEQGVGAHHAGLVPAFKETVEELFESGLLKVVFATETLALGINMPARSVVIENLSKFNGESHELLRPGDYTQLTGRAGRRGIDTEGFGVVLHSSFVPFRQVTEIASVGAHELRSSFRPTYNMSANLISNYPKDEVESLLEASFAAFQRVGDAEDAESATEALEHELAKEEEQAMCDLGDIEGYLAAVEAAGPERRQDGIRSVLGPGAVVDVIGGSRDGRYAVLKRLASKEGGARYLVLSTSGKVSSLSYRQIPFSSVRAGSVELPRPFKPRDRRFIQETLRRLRKVPSKPSERQQQRRSKIQHPVAECPDASRHLTALRRANKIRRRLDQHQASKRRSKYGLVQEFQSIRHLLEDLDYVSNWALTPRGERLRQIYNESDLLLAESIERGVFQGLRAVELAALLSAYVYEPRSDQASPPEWPTPELYERWASVEEVWKGLTEREKAHRLTTTRRPDPGFGMLAYQWAQGTDFDDLQTMGMAPGDFVRVSRQLADLLRQLRDSIREMDDEVKEALVLVDRGVVAAQGIG